MNKLFFLIQKEKNKNIYLIGQNVDQLLAGKQEYLYEKEKTKN